MIPHFAQRADTAPARRSAFVASALLGGLALVVTACHGGSEAPPTPSYSSTPPAAEVTEKQDSTSAPSASAEAKQSESSPGSADGQDKAIVAEAPAADTETTEPQKPAAPVEETDQADTGEGEESRPDDQPTESVVVVSIAPKEPVPAKPEPEIRPESLIGAGRSGLIVRLGTPTLLRREPPAEFWQFTGDGCVLHVYLYETGTGEDYEVTHVELLPRGGLDAVPPGCFGRMHLDGRRKAG